MKAVAANEPANHTVLLDRDGDIWVRYDEWPGQHGTWRHIAGPGWDEPIAGTVGASRSWPAIQQYGPLTEADPELAAAALVKVKEAAR